MYRSPAQPSTLVGAPHGALPATPPDQIEGTGGTRGPGRPKRFVVVTQGHRDRPAAGSRHRTTPNYKFTSTSLANGFTYRYCNIAGVRTTPFEWTPCLRGRLRRRKPERLQVPAPAQAFRKVVYKTPPQQTVQ